MNYDTAQAVGRVRPTDRRHLTEQGFPSDQFDLGRHRCTPITLEDVAGQVLSVWAGRPRPFHLDGAAKQLCQISPELTYSVSG